jgi:serine protease Do
MLIVLLLAFGASVASAKSEPQTSCDAGNSAHDSRMRRGVVAVIGPEMSGSGVLISPDEVLMTAHEVENEKVSVQVVTCDLETIRGAVVWIDIALDLALIKIERVLPDYLPMQGNIVRSGESISVVGHPDQRPWMISTGVVLREQMTLRVKDRHYRIQEHSLIVSSAFTTQGGSGGALVDVHGDLVGIVIASLPQYGDFSAAQPITNFCRAYPHSLCPP